MANLSEFQLILTGYLQQFENDLQCMKTVRNELPEVPEGVDYMQVASFDKTVADLVLHLQVADRFCAVKALQTLIPVSLYHNPAGNPIYQPRSSLDISPAFAQIFPAVYQLRQERLPNGNVTRVARLIWYADLQQAMQRAMLITAHIVNDPAYLLWDNFDMVKPECGLPTNGHVTIHDASENARDVSLCWRQSIAMDVWCENFFTMPHYKDSDEAATPIATKEDEWPQVITIEKEQ